MNTTFNPKDNVAILTFNSLNAKGIKSIQKNISDEKLREYRALGEKIQEVEVQKTLVIPFLAVSIPEISEPRFTNPSIEPELE